LTAQLCQEENKTKIKELFERQSMTDIGVLLAGFYHLGLDFEFK